MLRCNFLSQSLHYPVYPLAVVVVPLVHHPPDIRPIRLCRQLAHQLPCLLMAFIFLPTVRVCVKKNAFIFVRLHACAAKMEYNFLHYSRQSRHVSYSSLFLSLSLSICVRLSLSLSPSLSLSAFSLSFSLFLMSLSLVVFLLSLLSLSVSLFLSLSPYFALLLSRTRSRTRWCSRSFFHACSLCLVTLSVSL